MLGILNHRTYRHLFFAQVFSILGTGLATFALNLMAFDLAGNNAGQVLGTAMAIKMVAYVLIALLASALAENLPRRVMLVSLDLVRAATALALPFVTEVWKVYVLIAVLQSAATAFTPMFQSTILWRQWYYWWPVDRGFLKHNPTIIGFIASALLVVFAALPAGAKPEKRRGVYERARRGIKIFAATPRLRGLMALNLVVSLAGAMVIVNTVVLVQGQFGPTDQHTAMAFAAVRC